MPSIGVFLGRLVAIFTTDALNTTEISEKISPHLRNLIAYCLILQTMYSQGILMKIRTAKYFPYDEAAGSTRDRGFALIITLTLMVLLTLLVVGLLTLSGISLREISQGEAMAAARANARMSLILGLGEL